MFCKKFQPVNIKQSSNPIKLNLDGYQFFLSDYKGFDSGGEGSGSVTKDLQQVENLIKQEKAKLQKAEQQHRQAAQQLIETKKNFQISQKRTLIHLIKQELKKGVLIDQIREYEAVAKKHLEK
jgi:hypothetical protein